MKKNIIALTLISALASCSSTYQRPESIESKMARFESKNVVKNNVPEYKVREIKIYSSRSPASASVNEMANTNRSVYFLSLMDQYQTMAELFPMHKEKINVCPTFHQELLKKDPRKYSYEIKENIDFSKASIVSSIASSKSELSNSVSKYMSSTHQEIVQLCTTGYSENYYIYENLVTLSAKKGILNKDEQTLNAYLKTTVFYNDILISKISNKNKIRTGGRTIASSKDTADYTHEAINRIKATWAKELLK